MPKTPRVRSEFDRAYYAHYYGDAKTASLTQADATRLAKFVFRYLEFLQIPIGNILDLGCGVGLWQRALKKIAPKAHYKGVETSPYLCEKFGWEQSSIGEFKSRHRYDLVICQGVLPYLSNDDATYAIDRLARLCRGGLYLEAVTRDDFDSGACDPKRTDDKVHMRSASWYRRRLKKHFVGCGGGVFIPRASDVALFELEKV